MKQLYPFMLAGTGSDVGKSVVAAAFCRILKQDGYTPAPFKAQNMALNSYATPEGFEIGRAQAVQAEAAQVPCHTDMNPLLLKPTGDMKSQVVLHGKPIGNRSAKEYYRNEGHDFLRAEVYAAFDRLQARYQPIVMEGAGSISEINLRHRDLVNMPMAIHAGAHVILVADIDRGGVFASLYGSVMLLTPEERKHLSGIIINKFRGDISLFQSGIQKIEELCGVPVLGVIPYYQGIDIEAEDSVILDEKTKTASQDSKINVAVVLLRHMANFTDFSALANDNRVHQYYTDKPEELAKADIIVIPGSKNTIHDMSLLRSKGLASEIMKQYHAGKQVVGICGGYQMMGCTIADPMQQEGDIPMIDGLGILPTDTILQGDKVTRQVQFEFSLSTDKSQNYCAGYEIHQGETTRRDFSTSDSVSFEWLNTLSDGTKEGLGIPHRCMGSYIHGLLDNTVVIDYLLAPYSNLLQENNLPKEDYQTYKSRQYDALAQHVRNHVDIDKLYSIISNPVD